MKHSSTFRIAPPVNHPILRIFLFAVLLAGISLPLAAQSDPGTTESISYADLVLRRFTFRALGSIPLQFPSTTNTGSPITYEVIRGSDIVSLTHNIVTLTGVKGPVTLKASQNGGGTWPSIGGSLVTFIVDEVPQWKKVVVGRSNSGSWTIALKEDGTMWSWGSGAVAAIGVDGLLFRRRPTQTGTESDWAEIFGYNSGPCFAAIKKDGRLYTWGNNSSGELGLGHTLQVRVPTLVNADTDWKMAACGFGFILALKNDGSLWAAGTNAWGQFGNGTQTSSQTFVRIGTESNWATLSAGYYSSYALKSDGSLWAWGGNGESRLGDGTAITRLQPVRIGQDSDWASLQAGYTHAVALKNDGTLWAWGRNTSGQIGNGTLVDVTTPTAILPTSRRWKFINAGRETTAAIDTTGKLAVWGANLDKGGNYEHRPLTVGTETNWEKVAYSEHAIALKNDKSIWSWGIDQEGELGNSSWGPQQIAIQEVTSFSGSVDFNAFIQNGELRTQGINANGQLGITSSNFLERSPKRVNDNTDWQVVSVGGRHALALKNDGTLWAWGNNEYGQVGNNSSSNVNAPIAILPNQRWKKIHAGLNHSVAIDTSNSIWTWGDNAYGQLGLGNTTLRRTPVKVGTATDWADIAAYNHTLALKTDGSLWAWGENLAAQLGLGDELAQNAPVRVGGSNEWKKISAGQKHSAALMNDNSLWTWGSNAWGELGYSHQGNKNTPGRVGTENDWADVNAGYQFSVALKTNGTLWTTGSNFRGGLMQRNLPLRDRYTLFSFTQVGTSTVYESLAAGGIKANIAMIATKTGDLWGGGNTERGSYGNIRVSTAPRRIYTDLLPQNITAPSSIQIPPSGGPIYLQAESESGLPLQYHVKGEATVSGGQLTVTGSAPIRLMVYHQGNNMWDSTEPVMINVLMPEIAVEKTNGENLISNSTTITFSDIEAKRETHEVFYIRNLGNSDLNISSIKIEGASADEFSVNKTGPIILQQGVSDSIQVTFKPLNDLTGNRTATLKILSDDVDEATFTIALSAMAYSNNRDADADGLHDWAEYKLASLGFDWQSADPEKVALLGEAGLHTEDQIETIHAGKFLMKRDPETQDFHVSFTLQKSSNLTGWTPQPVTLPSLEVDAEGRIHFRFQSTGSSSFLRFVVD